MTRPKRHLCVIGDSDTISKYVYPFLLSFITHARQTLHLSRKRGKPGSASYFSAVMRETKHTKPRADHAVTRHTLVPLTYRVGGYGRTRRC
jgi:hypothetical protein